MLIQKQMCQRKWLLFLKIFSFLHAFDPLANSILVSSTVSSANKNRNLFLSFVNSNLFLMFWNKSLLVPNQNCATDDLLIRLFACSNYWFLDEMCNSWHWLVCIKRYDLLFENLSDYVRSNENKPSCDIVWSHDDVELIVSAQNQCFLTQELILDDFHDFRRRNKGDH